MLASIPHGGSAARAIVNPELGTALITRDHDQVIAAFREAVGIGGAYARRGARDGVVRTQTLLDLDEPAEVRLRRRGDLTFAFNYGENALARPLQRRTAARRAGSDPA